MPLRREIIEKLHSQQSLSVGFKVRDVEIGPDSTGNPSVTVWLELEQDGVDFETRTQLRDCAKRLIEEIYYKQEGVMPWVYIRFRTASELQAS